MFVVACDQCKKYKKNQRYALDDSGSDGYESWSYTLCKKCYKDRMYKKDVVVCVSGDNIGNNIKDEERASVTLYFKDWWDNRGWKDDKESVVYTGPLGKCLKSSNGFKRMLPRNFMIEWFSGGDDDFYQCSPYINDDAWTDEFKQKVYNFCKGEDNDF